jgi:threonine synthase
MHFISTRNQQIHKTLSKAIQSGLADDGGLFIPECLPRVDLQQFAPDLTYAEFAQKILHNFFINDFLGKKIAQLCNNAFTFPVPLKKLNDNTFMLELFHGPTSSFKDFGARFLAECLDVISENQKTTIMVATSGDTGSAVASAFYQKSNINVIILYPDKKISERQQHQITCWDNNILALAVDGTFDDCQYLVKKAFQDKWWQKNLHLSSANSINIGRLLPQIIYYAYSSVQFYHRYKIFPSFIVPTGNLGNATSGYWAKIMGFPIREIVLATNTNKIISDYLETGQYHPRHSISTLANAMDVGNPSNFERLQYLFNSYDSFKNNVKAVSVNDDDIRKTIKDTYQQYKTIICPHTATACFARQKLAEKPWIIVATADPSKFYNIVEPIIQTQVPLAPQMKNLLNKPTYVLKSGKKLENIQEIISKYWG